MNQPRSLSDSGQSELPNAERPAEPPRAAQPREKLERERKTLAVMIELFCRDHHGVRNGLCQECGDLAAYAAQRLDNCPFQDNKPTCAKCPVHCYKPARREQVRAVMRYAGPRLWWRRPILTIRHLLTERKQPPEHPRRRSAPATDTGAADS